MSDGHLIDSYPQTSLSLRQCCKAAVQQALKCCLLFSTNRTKYSVLYIECSVEMHNDIVWVLHMYSTQCQCEARKLKPGRSCFEDWSQVRYLCVPQIQCWIDGGFHASPLHSHQCWVSQCKALCCTVRTVCTACCTGQETKSSTVGVQESQHPFQQSRWRWWPGGKVKSAAKVKLPEGRHFGTNCSESQYCKERFLIQF